MAASALGGETLDIFRAAIGDAEMEVLGNLEEQIEEAARFVTDYPFEIGATLIARGPDDPPRERRPRFKPFLLRKRR